MHRRKTKLMIVVEDKFQRSLEIIIPELVNDRGMVKAADEMGISKACLGYWMLKLGISIQRVAVPRDHTVDVVQK